MTVLLDTSFIAAYLNARDPLHPTAKDAMSDILAGKHGLPILCDAVLDELLTLLQRRTGRREHAEAALAFTQAGPRRPALATLLNADAAVVQAAVPLFLHHFDKGLSFTDCILLALSKSLGATIASFDGGFNGLAERIP